MYVSDEDIQNALPGPISVVQIFGSWWTVLFSLWVANSWGHHSLCYNAKGSQVATIVLLQGMHTPCPACRPGRHIKAVI